MKGRLRAEELCESRSSRPGLPVPNSPFGLCGRKATLNLNLWSVKAEKLCESRGGRPGLPVPNSPFGLCGSEATVNLKRKQDYSADIIAFKVMCSFCCL